MEYHVYSADLGGYISMHHATRQEALQWIREYNSELSKPERLSVVAVSLNRS